MTKLAEELEEWRNIIKGPTKNPHKILLNDLEEMIPRMMEAGDSGNRSLVLSLADQILKRIAHNEETLMVPDVVRKTYKMIRANIKQYLIKSAYAGKSDFRKRKRSREDVFDKYNEKLIETPALELKDWTTGAKPKRRAKKKGREGVLVLDREEGNEDVGGVIQTNTKDVSGLGIRDVISDTDNFLETPEPLSNFVSRPQPPGTRTSAPKKYTTTPEIELDNTSKVCDGPFSIEDLTTAVNEKKTATLDDLIRDVDTMIKEA